jgi:hypothetical protein
MNRADPIKVAHYRLISIFGPHTLDAGLQR